MTCGCSADRRVTRAGELRTSSMYLQRVATMEVPDLVRVDAMKA
jgi:hypothetical protein